VLSDWQADIKNHQDEEVRFTASGWKGSAMENDTEMKM
jgi:hypothetical protein